MYIDCPMRKGSLEDFPEITFNIVYCSKYNKNMHTYSLPMTTNMSPIKYSRSCIPLRIPLLFQFKAINDLVFNGIYLGFVENILHGILDKNNISKKDDRYNYLNIDAY